MGDIDANPSAGARLTAPAAISGEHDLRAFSCGHGALDDWLRIHALKNDGVSSRTYVACAGRAVVAYYSLATGAAQRDLMPRKLRHDIPNPAPLMILGRLAVDAAYHGQGVGRGLLKDALQRVLAASQIVGCHALVVHAIDQTAAEFYIKYGFLPFPKGGQTLFLPIETIRAAV